MSGKKYLRGQNGDEVVFFPAVGLGKADQTSAVEPRPLGAVKHRDGSLLTFNVCEDAVLVHVVGLICTAPLAHKCNGVEQTKIRRRTVIQQTRDHPKGLFPGPVVYRPDDVACGKDLGLVPLRNAGAVGIEEETFPVSSGDQRVRVMEFGLAAVPQAGAQLGKSGGTVRLQF